MGLTGGNCSGKKALKIIYIASGAANMYCGSCMHDNALAAAMKAAGEDVSLFPLYTPMRLDEESVGERQIQLDRLEQRKNNVAVDEAQEIGDGEDAQRVMAIGAGNGCGYDHLRAAVSVPPAPGCM